MFSYLRHLLQTVGCIKMKLGMQVGLSPGHIVLDGDPAPLTQRGIAPIFGPYLLWPNCWMDQDATSQGARPQCKRHCVRWGLSSPLPKSGPPIFGPCLLWPNCWMAQDGTWHGGRRRPRPHCVRWKPSSPSQKGALCQSIICLHGTCF